MPSRSSAFRHFLLLVHFAALALSGAVLAQEPVGLYLANIPVSAAPTINIDEPASAFGALTRIEIETRSAEVAATLLDASGLAFRPLGTNRYELFISRQATLKAPPSAQDRAATFVIDFDELPVQALLSDFLPPLNGDELAALEAYVHRRITTKNYKRGFDIASEVAKRLAGDCTEHAVLTAALARGLGWSARVITGTLIIEVDTRLAAYGHAWTEVFADGQWRIVDATRPRSALPAGGELRYVPGMRITNEGPGFAMGLIAMPQAIPQSITNVAPAQAADVPDTAGCSCEE